MKKINKKILASCVRAYLERLEAEIEKRKRQLMEDALSPVDCAEAALRKYREAMVAMTMLAVDCADAEIGINHRDFSEEERKTFRAAIVENGLDFVVSRYIVPYFNENLLRCACSRDASREIVDFFERESNQAVAEMGKAALEELATAGATPKPRKRSAYCEGELGECGAVADFLNAMLDKMGGEFAEVKKISRSRVWRWNNDQGPWHPSGWKLPIKIKDEENMELVKEWCKEYRDYEKDKDVNRGFRKALRKTRGWRVKKYDHNGKPVYADEDDTGVDVIERE